MKVTAVVGNSRSQNMLPTGITFVNMNICNPLRVALKPDISIESRRVNRLPKDL